MREKISSGAMKHYCYIQVFIYKYFLLCSHLYRNEYCMIMITLCIILLICFIYLFMRSWLCCCIYVLIVVDSNFGKAVEWVTLSFT